MLRSVALISKAGILNPKNVVLGQFPRKLRAARILFSEECNVTIQCPDPCEEPCLMDQMPVPCGSWQKKFDDKLNESNRALILGGGFFLATILAMRKIGYVRGYDVSLF